MPRPYQRNQNGQTWAQTLQATLDSAIKRKQRERDREQERGREEKATAAVASASTSALRSSAAPFHPRSCNCPLCAGSLNQLPNIPVPPYPFIWACTCASCLTFMRHALPLISRQQVSRPVPVSVPTREPTQQQDHLTMLSAEVPWLTQHMNRNVAWAAREQFWSVSGETVTVGRDLIEVEDDESLPGVVPVETPPRGAMPRTRAELHDCGFQGCGGLCEIFAWEA